MAHRKHQNAKTKHHIIPRSRYGGNEDYNICMVEERKHRLYHELFSNLTPAEIVEYLIKEFWNGNRRWIT